MSNPNMRTCPSCDTRTLVETQEQHEKCSLRVTFCSTCGYMSELGIVFNNDPDADEVEL